MLRRFSLKTVLIVGVVITALVPAGILGIRSARALRELGVSETMLMCELLAQGLAAEYEQYLTLHLHAVGTAAALAGRVNSLAQTSLDLILTQIAAHYPAFESLLVVDSSGKGIAYIKPRPEQEGMAIGVDFSDRHWFRAVMERRKPLADPQVIRSRVTGRLLVILAAPVVGAAGQMRGVVSGGLDLTKLQEVANRIHLGKTGRATMATNKGIVMAHSDPTTVQVQRDYSNLPIWRIVTARETGQISVYSPRLGGKRIGGFATVPGVGWKVWVTQAISEEDQEILGIYRRESTWVLLCMLAAMGFVTVLAAAIARPIQEVQVAATAIAGGDLFHQAPEGGPREVGAMARAFNQMASALSAKQAEVQQHARNLEQTNRELESFSYSVSHDLRAPLRAMDGFARILAEEHAGELSPEAQRYLRLVRQNACQMGVLVDDLLSFSRLSRQEMVKHPVDVRDLVREVWDDLRSEREGRQVELALGELPSCEADPRLLRQVFLNLLSNALKFTRKRAVARVEVRTHTRLECGARGTRSVSGESAGESAIRNLESDIVYCVHDNGVGFDMRYVGKLFGVFQRLHRAEEYAGTGVGLAIVQRIIHRHGGRVWAEGAVDEGATFSFTLGGDPSHD